MASQEGMTREEQLRLWQEQRGKQALTSQQNTIGGAAKTTEFSKPQSLGTARMVPPVPRFNEKENTTDGVATVSDSKEEKLWCYIVVLFSCFHILDVPH